MHYYSVLIVHNIYMYMYTIFVYLEYIIACVF